MDVTLWCYGREAIIFYICQILETPHIRNGIWMPLGQNIDSKKIPYHFFHHHHNHHHHHRHHHFQVGNPGIDITAVVEDAILNAEDAVGLDALRRV